jgi:hypothetical protein
VHLPALVVLRPGQWVRREQRRIDDATARDADGAAVRAGTCDLADPAAAGFLAGTASNGLIYSTRVVNGQQLYRQQLYRS